jgi:hypothetical protein
MAGREREREWTAVVMRRRAKETVDGGEDTARTSQNIPLREERGNEKGPEKRGRRKDGTMIAKLMLQDDNRGA